MAQGQRHTVEFMFVSVLPLVFLTSKTQGLGDRRGEGRGASIVNLPFQKDRKARPRKGDEDNGFYCNHRARCIALEKIDLSEEI